VIEASVMETLNLMCCVSGRVGLQSVSGTFCVKRV